MKRILPTAATWLVSLVAVAAIAFVIVIVLAGPHAGLLPHFLKVVVLVLGWLSILVVPIFLASRVWRRMGRSP